jgi:hypothetical protein
MKLALVTLTKLEKEVFQLMEKYIDENNFSEPPVLYLEGGHYDPRYAINDFSIDSLTHVLNIANNLITTYKGRIKIVIGILVDNLGLQCTETSCDIHENGKSKDSYDELPPEIEKILDQYFIVKRDKILISNERNCKNKTISFLKKAVKTHHDCLSIEHKDDIDSVVFHAPDQQDIQLAEIKNTITWSAKCPSIMAQHYSNVTTKILKRFPGAQDVTIIDFSEIDDINKVTRGVETAFEVYLPEILETEKINIHNVFMTDFGGDQYTIKKGFFQNIHAKDIKHEQ